MTMPSYHVKVMKTTKETRLLVLKVIRLDLKIMAISLVFKMQRYLFRLTAAGRSWLTSIPDGWHLQIRW
jgi:hypothetical protein